MTSTYQICSTFKKHSIVVRVLKAQPGVGAILVSLPYNNVYLKCQIDVGILKKKIIEKFIFLHTFANTFLLFIFRLLYAHSLCYCANFQILQHYVVVLYLMKYLTKKKIIYLTTVIITQLYKNYDIFSCFLSDLVKWSFHTKTKIIVCKFSLGGKIECLKKMTTVHTKCWLFFGMLLAYRLTIA